jgi:hypothetical protein
MNKEKINEFVNINNHKFIYNYLHIIFEDIEISKYLVVSIANDILSMKQKNIIYFYGKVSDNLFNLINYNYKYKLCDNNNLIVSILNNNDLYFCKNPENGSLPKLPNKLKYRLSIICINEDYDDPNQEIISSFNNLINENINYMKNNKYFIVVPKKIQDNLLMEDYI